MQGVGVGLIVVRRCVTAVVGDVVVILLKLSNSFLFLALHLSPFGSTVLKPNL